MSQKLKKKSFLNFFYCSCDKINRFSDIVIGEGTTVGEKCIISRSVIGKNCVIGSNVKITKSVIMNNVTIENE